MYKVQGATSCLCLLNSCHYQPNIKPKVRPPVVLRVCGGTQTAPMNDASTLTVLTATKRSQYYIERLHGALHRPWPGEQ